MKTKTYKYLVISFDSDEQQTFWDFVVAVNRETAEAFVSKHRPYVTYVVDCIGQEALRNVSKSLAGNSKREIGMTDMRERVKELVDMSLFEEPVSQLRPLRA